MVIQADPQGARIHPVSSTSLDHLDELRVATASSLPLNGLAPRTYAKGPRPHSRPSPVNAASLLIARGPPELIEIREAVEPMIQPVKGPEGQGRRPVVGRVCLTRHPGEPSGGGACIWRVPCHWHWVRY